MGSVNPLSSEFYVTPRPPPRRSHFSTGPPTPIHGFFPSDHHPNYPGQVVVPQAFSAPTSARHSRAPSPTGGFAPNISAMQPAQVTQALTNGLTGLPQPTDPQQHPKIHRLVPSEGPKTGGIEVACLGERFCQGLEVMFGDVPATTTTYWGDRLLVCLLPPAAHAGDVVVEFRHEHESPTTRPLNPRPVLFRYIDDDEHQLLKMALSVWGQKMTGAVEHPADVARRILSSSSTVSGPITNGVHRPEVTDQRIRTDRESLETMLLRCLDAVDLDDSPTQVQLDLVRPSGQSMLHLACFMGLRRFVAALLVRGANPAATDRGGFTPMHFAALSGHYQIVRRLLLAGANCNARSVAGLSPAQMTFSRDVLLVIGQSDCYNRRLTSSSHSLQGRLGTTASPRSVLGFVPASQLHRDRVALALENRVSCEAAAHTVDLEDTCQGQQGYIGLSRETAPSSVLQSSDGFDVPTMHRNNDGVAARQATAIMAWRNHLAGQLYQFQQMLHGNLPALPQMPTLPQMLALPPIPALPDYQLYLGNPMVRLGSLVPSRSSGRPGRTSGEAEFHWWDLFSSSVPPPAYDELYPQSSDQRQGSDLKNPSGSLLLQTAIVGLCLPYSEPTRQNCIHYPISAMDQKRLILMKFHVKNFDLPNT